MRGIRDRWQSHSREIPWTLTDGKVLCPKNLLRSESVGGLLLSRNVGAVCALFLILSICEAGLTAIEGSRVTSASTTERWFSSQAFADAARARKLATSSGAKGP
jgi:hypothetical protein